MDIANKGRTTELDISTEFASANRPEIDGVRWRNYGQTYDSTFTLDATHALNNLHGNSVSSPVPSLKAVSVFDDHTLYYDPANPQGRVKYLNTSTQIRIQSPSALDSFMQVEVRPVK